VLGIFTGVEGSEPTSNGNAQRFNFQPAMDGRKILQFQESCMEQVSRSLPVGAGMVMKRRSYLNQSLQKHLIGMRGFQPNLFPMFVGFVEVCRIERFQSLLVQAGSCMRTHPRFGVSSHLECRVPHFSRGFAILSGARPGAAVPNRQNSAFEFLSL
jgi:hypothetical protein